MPEGEVYTRFAEIIAGLAKAHGGPRFEPHVTLLGGVAGQAEAILASSRELAAATPPIEIGLGHADHQDAYFRCLFVRVAASPALAAAHERAARLLAGSSAERFEPHLSLMYGDLPTARKEEILDAVGRDFTSSFTCRTLDVFQTDGDPAQWQRLARFPLSVRDTAL